MPRGTESDLALSPHCVVARFRSWRIEGVVIKEIGEDDEAEEEAPKQGQKRVAAKAPEKAPPAKKGPAAAAATPTKGAAVKEEKGAAAAAKPATPGAKGGVKAETPAKPAAAAAAAAEGKKTPVKSEQKTPVKSEQKPAPAAAPVPAPAGESFDASLPTQRDEGCFRPLRSPLRLSFFCARLTLCATPPARAPFSASAVTAKAGSQFTEGTPGGVGTRKFDNGLEIRNTKMGHASGKARAHTHALACARVCPLAQPSHHHPLRSLSVVVSSLAPHEQPRPFASPYAGGDHGQARADEVRRPPRLQRQGVRQQQGVPIHFPPGGG